MIVCAALALASSTSLAVTGLRPSSWHPPAPTYRKDIAPMFAEKCTSCHWQDGPAPFSLEKYADLKKRLELIRKVALLHTMPPGRVTSDYGDLTTVKRLTDQDTVLIQHWIAQGAPEGDGPEQAAFEPPKWRLGTPSAVVSSGKILVPAEGPRFTKTVFIDLPESARKTLIAFDIRPKTPRAMRQAILAAAPNIKESSFLPNGIVSERLVGSWAFGYPAWKLPSHAGLDLGKSSALEVRGLYHPTGKEERGDFEIGLYFAEGPRPAKPKWIRFGRASFVIPGNPEYTTLDDKRVLSEDELIIGFVPEARNLASSVALSAAFAELPPKYLAVIAEWTPRWQGAYNFVTPPLMLSGTTITAEVSYDNSRHRIPDITLDEYQRLPKNNPVNSGPGEKDELFWIHVQVVGKP